MPRPPARAVLAACLLAGCEDATAPLPRDGVPDALEVTFGGFGYGSHTVTLQGDTLVVVRRAFSDPGPARPDSTRVVRDAAAWRAFWASARAAGVERWPRECVDSRVADGGGFTLRIAAGGTQWEASGVNSYPRANGRCTGSPDHSPEYEAFMEAVSALIGRPFPG